MATLMLPEMARDGSTESSVSLRQWLDGHWALLFSHPDDFVQCELELDRWIAIVAHAFAQARVRPVALARRHRPADQGWVTAVSGTSSSVRLYQAPRGGWCEFDLAARRLHEHISTLSERFAILIDSAMRRRRTFLYAAADRPPSPIDLVALASELREGERDPECILRPRPGRNLSPFETPSWMSAPPRPRLQWSRATMRLSRDPGQTSQSSSPPSTSARTSRSWSSG